MGTARDSRAIEGFLNVDSGILKGDSRVSRASQTILFRDEKIWKRRESRRAFSKQGRQGGEGCGGIYRDY